MTDFLLLAFIFLVAGVASVPIASRLGLGSVLGYLIAGILISPLLAALGVDVVSIQHFAEFGVVMMLFLVGLELEPRSLWAMRGRLLGLGGGQVAVTTLAVTAVALALGQSWSVALAIGLVLALSSTAIALQTLNEKGLMRSDGGEASFSVLLFQDIAVIPMLALIPLLAMPELMDVAAGAAGHGGPAAQGGEIAAAVADADHAGGGHGAGGLSLVAGLNAWQTALVNLAAIAAVVGGGAYLTRPVFRFISSAQLRELFTAAALMYVIGIALLMTLVGLSPALGTFLAGVVLANSEYRHELESDIDPFRGLLLGLFFMTVGAGINSQLLFDSLAITIGLTAGLIALKMIVLGVLGLLFGLRGADKWLFALGIAQAGEFGFVLLSFTGANSVVPSAVADQLLLVVALSMLLTPVMFIVYDRLIVPRYNAGADREADELPDASGHIIIAGSGRVGGIVHRMLRSAGYTPTVIDYNSKHLENLRTFGTKVYFGDATRPDLLHAAGIEDARLLVIAIDNEDQITELVRYVLKTYPNLHVIARAINRHHVYHLWAVGCRDIIRDTYDSSLRMGRSAYEALGAPNEKAMLMMEEFNKVDRQGMIELANAYDIDIPPVENKPYVAAVKRMVETREPALQARMKEILGGDAPAAEGTVPQKSGHEARDTAS